MTDVQLFNNLCLLVSAWSLHPGRDPHISGTCHLVSGASGVCLVRWFWGPHREKTMAGHGTNVTMAAGDGRGTGPAKLGRTL